MSQSLERRIGRMLHRSGRRFLRWIGGEAGHVAGSLFGDSRPRRVRRRRRIRW